MKFEHALPSTDIHTLLVTPAMVDNPCCELERILATPDDPERESAFRRLMSDEERRLEKWIALRIPEWEKTYGIHLSDDRVRLIIRHALDQQTDVEAAVEEVQTIRRRVHDFAEQFLLKNDLEISFSDDAVDALAEKVWKEPQDPGDCLKTVLHNYSHGLKLIQEKTGKRQFLITAGVVEKPDHYLNCLIQEAYRQESGKEFEQAGG
jgi:hypothetical protein